MLRNLKLVAFLIFFLGSGSLWGDASTSQNNSGSTTNNNKAAASENTGEVSEEKHTLPHFLTVNLSGEGTLFIKQSDDEGLTVEAETAILPLVNVSVNNNTLYLELKEASSHPEAKLNYYLNVKTLQNINVFSSSNIYVQNGFKTDVLNLAIHGFGIASLNIDVKQMSVKVDGGGTVKAEGNADTQFISISGAGEFHGEKLSGKNGTVNISGTALVTTDVSDTLATNISGQGQGHVKYCQHPKLTKNNMINSIVAPFNDPNCK